MPTNFYPDETLIHLINLGMAPDLAELVAQGQFDLFTIKRTGPSSSPLPSQGTSGTQGQFSGDPDGLVLRQTDGKFDKQAHAMDVINVTTPDNRTTLPPTPGKTTRQLEGRIDHHSKANRSINPPLHSCELRNDLPRESIPGKNVVRYSDVDGKAAGRAEPAPPHPEPPCPSRGCLGCQTPHSCMEQAPRGLVPLDPNWQPNVCPANMGQAFPPDPSRSPRSHSSPPFGVPRLPPNGNDGANAFRSCDAT